MMRNGRGGRVSPLAAAATTEPTGPFRVHATVPASSKFCPRFVYLLTIIGCTFVLFNRLYVKHIEQQLERNAISNRPSIYSTSSSCSEYRSYPWPGSHSGLPYLGDVFASPDAEWIYMIAINRGMCLPNHIQSDSFALLETPLARFMCVFPDQTHVLTEYVRKVPDKAGIFVIRCRIPDHFQELVLESQETAKLHIDLHSMDDFQLDGSRFGNVRPYPSVIVTETPKLEQLPVCHALQNQNIDQYYNMIAVTSINSQFGLLHDLPNAPDDEATKFSPLPRVMDWIDYHVKQGFDHIVIYDNDEQPHGPLEALVQPLVDSGLVTYRWFPLKSCSNQDVGVDAYTNQLVHPWAQAVGAMSTLHRFKGVARFVAHVDVDEFFVPLQTGKTVWNIVSQAKYKRIDAFVWKSIAMAPCNGDKVSSTQSVLEKWKCIADPHQADTQKLILRTDTMENFWVHVPLLAVDGSRPKEHLVNESSEGIVAHYRSLDGPAGRFWRDDFSGRVKNSISNKAQFIEQLLRQLKVKQQSRSGHDDRRGGVDSSQARRASTTTSHVPFSRNRIKPASY